MTKFLFKSRKHELNFKDKMELIPESLRSSKEIQAVVYFISLIESYSPGATEYIFKYVTQLLGPGFFDHPDTDVIAKSLALHLWEVTYLAFEEDFFYYLDEISTLD